MPETPFFIVGNPRSGTTLLRFILSSHSRIYIPEETGFLPHLGQYLGRALSRDEVNRLVDQIGQMNAEWLDLVTDRDAFFEALPQASLRHVLDQLYRIKIADHDAQRWGDKGPSYVRVLPEIDRIFPTARYIHMIRDGRDCTLSAIKKWGKDTWYYDTYYLMRTWVRNLRAGQEAGERLGPQRYLEIRYEELVVDVEGTVRRICSFLDEQFEPSMLDHTDLARQLIAPTGHFEVERPVTPQAVGNWQKNMASFDQKVAVRVAGRDLEAAGYEVPSLRPFSLLERVRYARLVTRFSLTDTTRRALYTIGWLRMSHPKRAR